MPDLVPTAAYMRHPMIACNSVVSIVSSGWVVRVGFSSVVLAGQHSFIAKGSRIL